MSALGVILLITFVVASLFIIFLVLLQNEEGDSIGGLFAGGSNSAFGSRSGNVLTKSTYVLVTIFFVSSFVLAILNKTSSAPTEGIIKEGQEIQKENATPWYDEEKKDAEKKVEDESVEKLDSKSSSEEKSDEPQADTASVSENAKIEELTSYEPDITSVNVIDEASATDAPPAESEAGKTE